MEPQIDSFQPIQVEQSPKSPLSLPMILFLLVFLSLGLASYVFFQPKEVAQTTVVDEMGDWNTYRNEEYGFEFKYPANLITENNSYSYLTIKNTHLPQEFGGSLPEGKMDVDFTDKGFSVSISNETLSDLKDFEILNVSNVLAYRYVGEWDTPGCGQDAIYVKDPSSKTGKDYFKVNFCAKTTEGHKEGRAVQMRIVKSFKFTN